MIPQVKSQRSFIFTTDCNSLVIRLRTDMVGNTHVYACQKLIIILMQNMQISFIWQGKVGSWFALEVTFFTITLTMRIAIL